MATLNCAVPSQWPQLEPAQSPEQQPALAQPDAILTAAAEQLQPPPLPPPPTEAACDCPTETSAELPPSPVAGKLNALEQWASIQTSMVGKQTVVFLDYDGTLSPIVSEPDRAFMPDDTRTVLREVASRFPTAIITGRSREKVHSFVRLDDMIYAGSHGFDISGPLHLPISCQVADEYRPMLSHVRSELERVTSCIDGAMVEDNKFAVSMHYRNVPPELVPDVFDAVDQQLRAQPNLTMKHGKKVLELRPNVQWNKGSALLWILRNLGLDLSEDEVFPFYLGDDITDEDAFLALRRGHSGAGILIRNERDDERKAESTHASYVLRDPGQVRAFLERLVQHHGACGGAGPADTLPDHHQQQQQQQQQQQGKEEEDPAILETAEVLADPPPTSATGGAAGSAADAVVTVPTH